MGKILGGLASQNEFQAKDPSAAIDRQSFLPQLANLAGQNQQVYGQQQDLAKALVAQSQGQGPNPAQNMLNQATGQNVSNQAALMASQRGASQNAGLMARQAALAGSGAQQQAAGQAATLGAQQQLGAQGQLGGLYGNMAQNALQGQNINQEALTRQNQQISSNALNTQGINAGIAQQNTNAQNSVAGGIAGGLGAIGGKVFGADGGLLDDGKFYGGESENKKVAKVAKSKRFPEHLEQIASIYHPGFNFSEGAVVEASDESQKAEVKGNSLKNDKVPAMLSEGEVVLPRSVMGSKNAPDKAKEFVVALMKKQSSKEHGDFKSALEKAIKNRRSK